MYVNDLQVYLNEEHTLRLLYADDLKIYVQVPTDQVERGIHVFTNLAHKVSTWSELNRLSLDVKKTKAIFFGSTHMVGLFKKLLYFFYCNK